MVGGAGIVKAPEKKAIPCAYPERHGARYIQMYDTACVYDEERPREEDADRLLVVSGVLRRVNVRPSPLRHGSTRILRTNTGQARGLFWFPGRYPVARRSRPLCPLSFALFPSFSLSL